MRSHLTGGADCAIFRYQLEDAASGLPAWLGLGKPPDQTGGFFMSRSRYAIRLLRVGLQAAERRLTSWGTGCTLPQYVANPPPLSTRVSARNRWMWPRWPRCHDGYNGEDATRAIGALMAKTPRRPLRRMPGCGSRGHNAMMAVVATKAPPKPCRVVAT